jgi:hypothetical protein
MMLHLIKHTDNFYMIHIKETANNFYIDGRKRDYGSYYFPVFVFIIILYSCWFWITDALKRQYEPG